MKKEILIVVDMQNDFINGAIGSKDAQKIVPNVSKLIDSYIENGGEHLIYTRDTHYENYLETQEGKKLPVTHCIEGTEGWYIHPEVFRTNSVTINKNTFGSVDLVKYIKENIIEREKLNQEDVKITLIGVCTDICVVSNALLLKANFPEASINVCKNCCAGVTKEKHEAAIETMLSCQINVYSIDKINF